MTVAILRMCTYIGILTGIFATIFATIMIHDSVIITVNTAEWQCRCIMINSSTFCNITYHTMTCTAAVMTTVHDHSNASQYCWGLLQWHCCFVFDACGQSKISWSIKAPIPRSWSVETLLQPYHRHWVHQPTVKASVRITNALILSFTSASATAEHVICREVRQLLSHLRRTQHEHWLQERDYQLPHLVIWQFKFSTAWRHCLLWTNERHWTCPRPPDSYHTVLPSLVSVT